MSSSKKKIALGVMIVILAVVGFLGYYVSQAADYKDTLPGTGSAETDPEVSDDYRVDIGSPSNVVYLVFLGIDKNDERSEYMGVYRTDSVSLIRMDLDRKTVRVLGIPRDTYTFIPVENKMDKINHAYAFGSLQGRGVEEAIKAINGFVGKETINYYFLIDMEPIPSIVDEIGGVEINVETDLKDINIYKGLQRFNGDQALEFIRDRNTANGDIDRIRRQQQFFSAIWRQQRDSGRILESIPILFKHRDHYKTDLSVKQFIGLGRFLMEVQNDGVDYYVIPGDCGMINGVSYWIPDKEETKEVLNQFFREP